MSQCIRQFVLNERNFLWIPKVAYFNRLLMNLGPVIFTGAQNMKRASAAVKPKGCFCIKWLIGVSDQNPLFCPTVQAVHLKNHCIATIFGDQKCFQHNQHLSAQKARFFKSDANSDFDR